ncbi:MAG TPA: MBL fold metallo-hydrolase [Burkholderiaceae bacterium]|nr:MBL fold metallo-hydrolase [Burkholderiaceae bacterium]
MNPQEQRLDYPQGDRLPEPGRTIEVAPGVRWVRMGLPFALDHINLWLLRDEQDGRAGWTIVDCGIANDTTRQAWEQVFEHELEGLPVLRVIVTHMHPDHIGLAHWLTERWSTGGRECRLWISATDFNAARIASQSTTGYGGDSAARFFASHGLTDPESLQKVRARANYYASMVPQVPAQFRRLMDGLAVEIGGRTWRCIVGYGHSPEHISLYCDELRVLISGDMLLPRISTNVSVIDLEPEANPLPLYLRSVHAFESLPQDTLVLPSHGRPFRGLHERVRQLQEHHDLRLGEVMDACRRAPRSAADLLPVLFKRALDLHQTTFAIGESIAHLHTLWLEGRLHRERGADGVFRFAPA